MTERLGAISSVRTSHYFFGGKEEGRRYFSRLFDLLRFSEDFGAQQSVFQLVCSLFPRDSLLDVPALFFPPTVDAVSTVPPSLLQRIHHAGNRGNPRFFD